MVEEITKDESSKILEIFVIRKQLGIADRFIPKDLDIELESLRTIVRVLNDIPKR